MFIRMVKAAPWAQLQERGAAAIYEAVAELTQRGPLVSVYACATRSEIELVAVALSATRHRQSFHFLEIEDADLAAAEIPAVRAPGTTGVPDADRLHRDLDLGADRAERLVARLVERGFALQTISWRDLRAIAKRLAEAGLPIAPDSWLLA